MDVRRIGVGLVLALGMAGCEASAVGPEGQGALSIGIRGAGSGEAQSSAWGGSGQSGADGTVAIRARVWVQSSAGEWIEVTSGAESHTVDLAEAEASGFASGELAAGAYGRVRIEFEEVRARLTSGVSIALPVTAGEVAVDLGGDGKLVVERSVEVRVGAEAESELTVNLHAERWLGQASAGAVAEAAFESAVTVTQGEG